MSKRVLPGFGLSLGLTLVYLSLLILLPLSALVFKSSTLGFAQFWDVATGARALAAYRVTFGASLLAALINAVFGLIVAWILVRYSFPGKRLVDSLVDLPFALPTAVAGITLATLYAGNGWIGRHLEPLGLKVAFTPLGIVVALTFISLPFVVRTLQPVIEDIEPEIEEAAATLGASRWQTFSRVLMPAIFPALLTGFTLAFSRAIGEYGSVIFIAGNMPLISEITPLLIISKLEQYDVVGATALACVMLAVAASLGMFQILMRFVFEEPAEWTEVLIRFSLIWMVFLAIPSAFRQGAMVSVDVLYRWSPPRIRRVLDYVVALAALALIGVIIWWGWDYAQRGGVQSMAGLESVSMFWAYVAMPVGGVFSAIGILGNLVDPQRLELETAQ